MNKIPIKIISVIVITVLLLASCGKDTKKDATTPVTDNTTSSVGSTTGEDLTRPPEQSLPQGNMTVDTKLLSAKTKKLNIEGTVIGLTDKYIFTHKAVYTPKKDGEKATFQIVTYNRETLTKKIATPVFDELNYSTGDFLFHNDNIYFEVTNKDGYNEILEFNINTGKSNVVYMLSEPYSFSLFYFFFTSDNQFILSNPTDEGNIRKHKVMNIDLKTKKETLIYEANYDSGNKTGTTISAQYVKGNNIYLSTFSNNQNEIVVIDTNGNVISKRPCAFADNVISYNSGHDAVCDINIAKNYLHITTLSGGGILFKDNEKAFDLSYLKVSRQFETTKNVLKQDANKMVFFDESAKKVYMLNADTDKLNEVSLDDAPFKEYLYSPAETATAYITQTDGKGSFIASVHFVDSAKQDISYLVTVQ